MCIKERFGRHFIKFPSINNSSGNQEPGLRTNLPVTGIEYPLMDSQSIVSETDTKGRIVYVNPTFIDISGFAEEATRRLPTCGIR